MAAGPASNYPEPPMASGSAFKRTPTPGVRRVKWHDMTGADDSRDSEGLESEGERQSGEVAGARAPRDALAAMRTLASLPGATPETTSLLDQLEAHLAATTAAAELQEARDLPMTTEMPSPIRPLEDQEPEPLLRDV